MRKVLIVGATSAIAQATARLLAAKGDHLFLAGRAAERLEMVRQDLAVRGAASVGVFTIDANDRARHEALLNAAEQAMGGLDTVLIAHGSLPDQRSCETSVEQTLAAIETNALSVITLATLIANRFEACRAGTIAVISSVAGDRGRKSNYVYGASKGMVSLFLQGLRNRLAAVGVQVLTIKPGFVDTPMTAAIPKGGPLWAKPDTIAADILAAIEKKRDVVYLPWFWWGIMLIIRLIPERIFKRLSL
ncbi:MAG: SDR family oxidoreductase [Alphaproteobacteria bacterium]|nr:SDR family oxidoreductase [Alphaproteobacteria bacterium]